MPRLLLRFQDSGNYHLIMFSCDGRRPSLSEPGAYQTFETVLEKMRSRHHLRIYGYVLMPEHVHLLTTEPPEIKLSTFIGIVKQEVSKKLSGNRQAFWLKRCHDVNLFNTENAQGALKYIHRNPVARGLVAVPEAWPWSSFRHYLTGEMGTVEIESWWTERARKLASGNSAEMPASV